MMADTNGSNSTRPDGVLSNSEPGKKRKGRGKTRGLSIQKKRKDSDSGKLKVTIPPDRTVAVGPGAKDFVTELSVKVLQNARHDVKNWKNVPILVKDRIVAHMLDTFEISDTQHNRDTILQTANNLYRYRRSRLHDHFKKYATKEESLQNKPGEVDEDEWKYLVEYFSSESFKNMSERNKINKAKQEMNHICGRKSFQAVSFAARDQNTGKEPHFQKLWEMTHFKNGKWVNDASAELNDKVKELAAEQLQEMEEGADEDPIYNDAFVKIVGERSGYCRGQGSGVKPANRRSMQGIKEQLQAQQKEVEEERSKRQSLECKLMEVQNQLEEERKNRQVMEARIEREQLKIKKGILALVSMQTSQTGIPAAILNILADSSSSDGEN